MQIQEAYNGKGTLGAQQRGNESRKTESQNTFGVEVLGAYTPKQVQNELGRPHQCVPFTSTLVQVPTLTRGWCVYTSVPLKKHSAKVKV